MTVAKAQRQFVLTRVFEAPRQKVWEAFTQARHLAQWWGPRGFDIEVARVELRPGGVFHYSMKAPNGQVMWGKFVYREVKDPELLSFVNCFSDEQGNVIRNPWMPNWPLEVLTTIEFTENAGKTTITLSGGPINATDDERKAYTDNTESMTKGFGGTFDQLAEYLKKL